MNEARFLKARCKKTGHYIGLEIWKIGGKWKVVNAVPLSNDEARIVYSEVRQPVFETNSNLVACAKCKNRAISGCNCSKRNHPCTADDFHFDCIYCKELEIDYSRPIAHGPYTKWAGQSNIPDSIKDRFGNPQGSQYDLAEDGSFKKYTIVVLNCCSECDFSRPRAALEKKGFKIVEYKSVPTERELRAKLKGDTTQLWIVTDRVSHLDKEHLTLIKEYFDSGHGVYFWGDNDPYYVDLNYLLPSIFNGVTVTGDRYGDKVLGIQQAKGDPGIVADHPITTGIVSFYEGITISEVIDPQGLLTPLIHGSERQIVAAYYDNYEKRAIIDGGFTRLYYKWDSAGTDRYVVNAAAWLANVERFGYKK